MNWLDVVFGLILLVSMAMSFRRGFTREIIGLVSAVFALILGMWFYGLAGSFVAPYVGSVRGANFIGFVLVVLGVMVFGAMVGWVISRFLKTIGLSFADRFFGACFGLVRGLFLSVALLTAVTAFGPHVDSGTAPQAVVHSQIAPWLLEASRYGVAIAPMELKQSFRKYYGQIQELWRLKAVKKADKDS